MAVGSRLAGKKAAKEIIDFADETVGASILAVDGEDELFREGYWRLMVETAIDRCPSLANLLTASQSREVGSDAHTGPAASLSVEAMSELAADRHGRRLVGFGKYADRQWRDVPDDYLQFLKDTYSSNLRYILSRFEAAADDDDEDTDE